MMNDRLRKAMVALLAVATVGACDDPPIEPGDSDAARLSTNPSFVVIEAGESRTVSAFLVNEQGNPVAGEVSFTACSGVTAAADPEQSELEPGTNFIVTGGTLGESCVNVSAGGFEETVVVKVVPGSIELTVEDTLLSGSTATSSVAFFDAAGGAATGLDISAVTFASLDEDIALVDPATGEITAQAPGEVQIVASLRSNIGAPRADTVTAVVVPGTFTGTISPTSAEPGDTVTITAGTLEFDESTALTFGGEPALIVSQSATEIVAVVPFGGVGSFVLTGLGESEVASVGAYTTTATGTDDTFEANDDFDEAAVVADRAFYAAVNPGNVDDFFEITIGATEGGDYNVTVGWWEDDADIDIFLFPEGGPVASFCGEDLFGCGAATTANPEGDTVTLVPGTYHLWVNLYDDHDAGNVTYEVRLDAQ